MHSFFTIGVFQQCFGNSSQSKHHRPLATGSRHNHGHWIEMKQHKRITMPPAIPIACGLCITSCGATILKLVPILWILSKPNNLYWQEMGLNTKSANREVFFLHWLFNFPLWLSLFNSLRHARSLQKAMEKYVLW